VPVDRDRVRALRAGREVRGARGEPREEAERAVHVEPGVVLLGEVGELVDRIEVAGVHLARVRDEDRGRAVELAQRGGERVDVEAADLVAAEAAERRSADAEHRETLDRRSVDVAAGEDRDRREARKAALRDIHAVPLAPPLPCRGERDDVRLRRPDRHEAAPAGRQAEEVAQPRERDDLELGAERRRRPRVRALVEHRREPVRAERGWRHTADDEVVVARATGRHCALEASIEQLAERRRRTHAGVRELATERPNRRLHPGRADLPVVERLEIRSGLARDELEDLTNLGAIRVHSAGPRRSSRSSAVLLCSVSGNSRITCS
jgi:hypothetical protein